MSRESKDLKCVLVGDVAVGKTCLAVTYAKKEFPKEFIPTVFDPSVTNCEYNGQRIVLGLWDTAGREEYDTLKPLVYANTNVFLICFSLVAPSSYENVLVRWHSEIRHYAPKTPIILVGTKMDLRNDTEINESLKKLSLQPITKEQGKILAEQIKASKYMECSSLYQQGLDKLFQEVVKFGIQGDRPTEKKANCGIL